MKTTYKIYANILNRKLKRETERKLEEGQCESRKGKETIDAIYILNYVVNKEITEKGKDIWFL